MRAIRPPISRAFGATPRPGTASACGWSGSCMKTSLLSSKTNLLPTSVPRRRHPDAPPAAAAQSLAAPADRRSGARRD
jgi:hypothetical protein